MKNFIFCHCLLTDNMAKTTYRKVPFWVSMDCLRSKELDESQFCLLTALSRPYCLPLPPSNVIPEAARNRVKDDQIITWYIQVKTDA